MAGNLTVRLESEALGPVHTYELRGVEKISQVFSLTVGIVTAATATPNIDEAIAKHAALVFARGDEELRRMHGMIAAVREVPLGEGRNFAAFEVTFVPRMWRLSVTETVDIHMDRTVPEIIQKKLEANGLRSPKDFEFRLRGKYPTREFVVQYQETDLNFVSRLAEHVGISFFFEHGEVDKVIFADNNSVHVAVPGRKELPYGHLDAQDAEELRVYNLLSQTRALPQKYILRDYNYRSPGMDLKASATVYEQGTGEVVEYGAHFKTPEEGTRLAKVRAEELLSTRLVFTGGSNAHHLAPGAHFVVEGHPRGDLPLLLTSVEHFARQAVLGLPIPNERAYRNEFVAIPKDIAYRPPRLARKPVVSGVVTGIVDAKAKTNYAELDDEGRYKVKFMFDTADRGEGQASRSVRMAQPSSGPGYGMHFPLRPGIEVVLTCVNGDPDRPIIAGTVPNPSTGSPVSAGNGTRNIIKTGGGTEMNFDDTEGEQRLKISVPHADTTFQLGSPNSPEVGAMLATGESFSAYAGQAVTQVSNVSNLFAATAKFFASTDITAFAGVSNALDGVEAVSGVIDATATFAKDAAGLPKAWKDIGSKKHKAQAAAYALGEKQASAELERARKDRETRVKAARDEAAAAGTRWAQAQQRTEAHRVAAGGSPPASDATYFRLQQEERAAEREFFAKSAQHNTIDQQTQEAVTRAENSEKDYKNKAKASTDAAAAVDAANAESDSDGWNAAARGIGVVADVAKNATKANKAVKDFNKARKALFGAASTVASEVAKGGAAGAVATGIAAGNALAGLTRVSGAVGALTKPYNLQGATGTAALFGLVNAVVESPVAAAVTGGAVALLGSPAKALVHSPGAAELTGVARALITSGVLIDAKSAGRIKTHSAASTSFVAVGSMIVASGASARITAKTNMNLKAGPKLEAKATNVKVEGSAKIDLKTTNYKLDASAKANVVAGSKIELKVSGSTVKVSASQIALTKGSTQIMANGSHAQMKHGGAKATLSGSGVKVNGPKVSITGSGGVKVTGAKIDLG